MKSCNPIFLFLLLILNHIKNQTTIIISKAIHNQIVFKVQDSKEKTQLQ